MKQKEVKSVDAESGTWLGNMILAALMTVTGLVFLYYMRDNKTFITLGVLALACCVAVIIAANTFFLKKQMFFDKWADAIRYSRYPATMIITNFSMVAFIAWLKVNTKLAEYLNMPIFLAVTLPFLFSSLCYGLCAYHTLIGNLLDKSEQAVHKSGRLGIIYWKMGQIFLVSALVPMISLVLLIAAYVI